jgi:hypothetical protein
MLKNYKIEKCGGLETFLALRLASFTIRVAIEDRWHSQDQCKTRSRYWTRLPMAMQSQADAAASASASNARAATAAKKSSPGMPSRKSLSYFCG